MEKMINTNEFTIENYKRLCRMALGKYNIATYDAIPWGDNFLLWRHDVDISLNRALQLAKIESEIGLKATYFINPHSEFYNLTEKSQFHIIKDIISLGHDIALHFDASFYEINSVEKLTELLKREAIYLKDLFSRKISAFSFHNPGEFELKCENERYAGLVNCYSKNFKINVKYCSDSNGYWRFENLNDVLFEQSAAPLQVLTHPGWWQNSNMPPRQRIFRSAYGRAASAIRQYDKFLSDNTRLNLSGSAEKLRVLIKLDVHKYELCDYLWNNQNYDLLFIELWRIYRNLKSNYFKSFFDEKINNGELKINIEALEIANLPSDFSEIDLLEKMRKIKIGQNKKFRKVLIDLIKNKNISDSLLLSQYCVILCDDIEKLVNLKK